MREATGVPGIEVDPNMVLTNNKGATQIIPDAHKGQENQTNLQVCLLSISQEENYPSANNLHHNEIFSLSPELYH